MRVIAIAAVCAAITGRRHWWREKIAATADGGAGKI
jgi:hypothetical protein